MTGIKGLKGRFGDNYNRVPRPPVVMLRGEESYLAVRRETLEDLIRLDEP